LSFQNEVSRLSFNSSTRRHARDSKSKEQGFLKARTGEGPRELKRVASHPKRLLQKAHNKINKEFPFIILYFR
jgi:hypothetical protein